jgi:cerevisin
VIAGVQYAMQQYKASGNQPSVVSLSLGGDKNSALDRAVQAAITRGLHFAVAAGNSNTDACLSSPASVSAAKYVPLST